MNRISESIFREYDIRGIVESELPDSTVEAIASALAIILKRNGGKRIAVGIDGRPHSPHIREIFCRRLANHGFHIIDLGLVPTPVLYYAVFKQQLDGGVIITASHNPPEYNGFKILIDKKALFGPEIREIYHIAQRGEFPARGAGKIETLDIIPDYIETIAADVTLKKKLKVVVDGGNGTGGITALPLYKKMGAEVVDIFCDVDGSFPNHHPDPTKIANLQDIIRKVKETGADIGIAFDGDADRIGVVDQNGTILWGDQMLVLFARNILADRPGATIISEVKASEVLYSEIKKYGGVPIMWKTGHSLIKKKIAEEGALLAGEMSGHIFFNDRWFGFDDAVYSGARLLEILAAADVSLPEIIDTIPKIVNTPEIRVETREDTKFPIVERIVAHFKKTHDVIDIDGARIKFASGWALVRASNTQPVLVVRFESDTEAHLAEIRALVEPVIERYKSELEG